MNLRFRFRRLGLALGLALMALGFSVQAATLLELNVHGSNIPPGTEVQTDIIVDPQGVQIQLCSYEVGVQYDPYSLQLLYIERGDEPDLYNPDFNDDPAGGIFTVADDCLDSKPSYFSTKTTLAVVHFMTTKTIAWGDKSDLTITDVNGRGGFLFNCDGRTPLPSTQVNDYIQLYPYEETTPLTYQYLDVTGDGGIDENDVDFLATIVSGGTYNVSDKYLVKMGGIQLDMRSNAMPDAYDVGIADALVRPTRFIDSGPNGICQSTATGDDKQEITRGNGYPNTIAIMPGPNNVINTTPAGDDVLTGMVITTGANGIVETYAAGDDVQNIPYGQGEPDSICVSPGADKKMASATVGDDESLELAQDTPSYLVNDYVPKGKPAKIVLVTPYPNRGTGNIVYLNGDATIPVIVKVVDQYGNPKPGLAPDMTVSPTTTGYAKWMLNGGLSTYITALPADKFLGLGDAPEGSVGALLYVRAGYSTKITASLKADPSKGIPSAISTSFTVDATGSGSNPPNLMTCSVATGSPAVGSADKVTINVTDSKGNKAPGYASRIKLISSRNMGAGALGAIDAEPGEEIFSDNFESGKISPPWQTESANYIKPYSDASGAWLGNYVVQATASVAWAGNLWATIDTSGFSTQKMKLSFQWEYGPAAPTYNSYLQVYFYDVNASAWRMMKNIKGGTQLKRGMKSYLWETIDLSGFKAQPYIEFRFYFNMQPNDWFRIDNVALSGYEDIYTETFESDRPGYWPSTLLPSSYINTGADGINNSTYANDDVAVIPRGQGAPNEVAIWPGANKKLDTSVGGDDQIATVGSSQVINTGANGVCDSVAAGDDYQVIPYKDGLPYARAINPGNNQYLDSTATPDDERLRLPSASGSSNIIVDITGGAEGSTASVMISRKTTNGRMYDYAFEKKVDLGGYSYAYLSFYTKTLSMHDVISPLQQFVCEVSVDGGKTWVPVWNFGGTDHGWTKHEIALHNDPRYGLVDGMIIRWHATMDELPTADAAYVDSIRIYASKGETDLSTAPTLDNGDGSYNIYLKTFTPGSLKLAAAYLPEALDTSLPDVPARCPALNVTATSSQIDPRSVRIWPDPISIKACDRLTYYVFGNVAGSSTPIDLTSLFRLEVYGPAKMTSPGTIQAQCFTYTNSAPLFVRAIPYVSTLYDPTAGGDAAATFTISGTIQNVIPGSNPARLQVTPDAEVEVVLSASASHFAKTNASGYFIFGAENVGLYTVKVYKTGFKTNSRANVGTGVAAGGSASSPLVLLNGADCDGDGTLDTADPDDDNDGATDGQEDAKTTNKCAPDSDYDGYKDNVDAFPLNPAEWLDTDGDGTGDNTDTDDDGDGLSDTDEARYGTDPLNPDTDGGGMNDGAEVSSGRDPLNPNDDGILDTDHDGLPNSIETNDGSCFASYSISSPRSSPGNADTDKDGINDYDEVSIYNTNPSCTDTDRDGLLDINEKNIDPLHCPSATKADSDNDGLCDGNVTVMQGATVICVAGEDMNLNGIVDVGVETDPCNPDSDGDLMPDGWEKQYKTNPLVNDAANDPDGDGLNNISEYINHADPFNPDTDGDGINDGDEVANHLDPAVPNWGTINVTSDPAGADVYIDGSLIYRGRYIGPSGPSGGTPLGLTTLKNEKHVVTLVKNNYFIYSTTVNVTLGQTYTVNPTLTYRVWEVFGASYPVLAAGHTIQIASGYAAPHATDLDKNGTVDLLVGQGNGQVMYYSNASGSTVSLGAGSLLQAATVTLDAGERAKPFVVDWNNDNKPDLLVGNSVGNVWLYTGRSTSTNFNSGNQLQAGGVALLVSGGNASPFVVDFNGDHLKDLIVGAGDGRIYKYINSGTDAAPIFASGSAITDADGHAFSAGSFAVPLVYDFDRDGNFDFGFGGADGQVGGCIYDVDKAGYTCTYPALNTTVSDVTTTVDVGSYAALAIASINTSSSQMALFIGNSAGLVYYIPPANHLKGDLDRNTKVDGGDYIMIQLSMGLCKGGAGYNPAADLTSDNCVSAADLTELAKTYGQTY